MIRKIINADKTFGANYDEELRKEYESKGVWPNSNYIELSKDQATEIDLNPDRYIYSPDVPGIFLGYPMGVVEREDYAKEQFEKAKQAKYSEITNEYDYANQYYVANLYDNIYANVSWIPTWTKVINLCSAASQETIPSPVRYYQKNAGDVKFKNVNIEKVSLANLKKQLLLLEGVQFNILQPKRNEYYKLLEESKTIDQINAIKVNYGFTLNEQESKDIKEKISL